ncbi:hypothetical protein MY11210_001086 [Beauveria gryllotalpidicola]
MKRTVLALRLQVTNKEGQARYINHLHFLGSIHCVPDPRANIHDETRIFIRLGGHAAAKHIDIDAVDLEINGSLCRAHVIQLLSFDEVNMPVFARDGK